MIIPTPALPAPPSAFVPESPDAADPVDDFSAEPVGIDPRRLLGIVQDACTLIQEYRNEMGIELGNPEPRGGSWAEIRRWARSEYAGSFIHRAGYGGFFDETVGGNLSLAVPARFSRLLAAKADDDLKGTDPFLAIMPSKVGDKERSALSKQVEHRTQDEITRSNCSAMLAESIRVSFVEGERPIKVTWVTDKTQRPEVRPVAVYPPPAALEGEPAPEAAAPKPIKTPRGNYIFEKDDQIATLIDAEGNFVSIYIPRSPIPDGQSVQLRLRKEPSFVLTSDLFDAEGKLIFAEVPGLVGYDVHKDCLEVAGIKFEDFIYDIRSATLDHSPLQCHVYDMDLDAVLAEYHVPADPGDKYATLDPETALRHRDEEQKAAEALGTAANLAREAARQARERIESMASGPGLSAQSMAIREMGERYLAGGSTIRRKVNIHETYYRVRVRPEDQHETWLFLVIDFARQIPLHAEYLGNMRMRKPPFRLLRGLESEPGRAYGVGVYQKFAARNLAIDFWFNRNRLKTTKESSADFYYPDSFQNPQDAQSFKLGTREIYALKEDSNGERHGPGKPPIFRVNLHETTEKEWDIINKLVETGQLEFGIVSIGDLQASESGIGKGGTATATRNIERTGNLVQRASENMMAQDITDIMKMAVETILENAELDDAQFTEGGELLAGLNRDEIRDLPRDVRLLLTKARSAESLETNTQVTAKILEYYNLPKWLQKKVRFAYVNILKTLDVQDADDVLTEPTDEEIAAEAKAGAEAGAESIDEHISIKFTDLPPAAKQQVLAKLGIEVDISAFAAQEVEEPGESEDDGEDPPAAPIVPGPGGAPAPVSAAA